uniref:K Homology domain-containing protein n=1 Tax=Cyprinus carpio carpio TaxID=630221 RepID=A0A8C1AKT2_CYPCA
MVGFIIGRGGEQISRIQQDSGCKIQIAPDSGGMPERSVTLTGSPDSIQAAKSLLTEIVEKGRPSPAFHHNDGPGMSVQEIMVPASKAGLVIGKGGETIKQLQERAGVKMVMIQEGPQNTGADKPLRISGDPFKVQQAKDMVMDLIRDQGFREQRGEYGSRAGGGESLDVPVPRFAVGIVIGRNGEMIKKIQNDTGVRIQFKPDDGSTPERIAQIMGPPDRAQHAADIMSDLLRSVQAGGPPGHGGRGRGRGQGNWNMGPPGGLQEFTFTVPTMKTGLIIGKGGETIKNISQQSGARIELQRNPPPNSDPNIKIFTVRGSPQQIDYARQLVEEKIGVSTVISTRPNKFLLIFYVALTQNFVFLFIAYCLVYTKKNVVCHRVQLVEDFLQPLKEWFSISQIVPFLTGDPQAPGQSGQADYTKAWEEYYKKLAAAAASQPGGQPDYSAAWAEYYRQQAAYYGQGTPQAMGAAPQAQQVHSH